MTGEGRFSYITPNQFEKDILPYLMEKGWKKDESLEDSTMYKGPEKGESILVTRSADVFGKLNVFSISQDEGLIKKLNSLQERGK